MIDILKTISAGAVALVLGTGAAGAATLSLSGGNEIFLPVGGVNGGFNPSPVIAGLSAGDKVTNFTGLTYTGGLSVSGPAKVTLTYLGKEASFSNTAVPLGIGGGMLTDSVVGGSLVFTQLVGGLVQFKFETNGDGGGNINNATSTSSNDAIDMAFKRISDTSYFALFGDGGGKNDDDFDDMIIRVDVAAVPLPAAGFLLIAALGGLAAMRRRKSV